MITSSCACDRPSQRPQNVKMNSINIAELWIPRHYPLQSDALTFSTKRAWFKTLISLLEVFLKALFEMQSMLNSMLEWFGDLFEFKYKRKIYFVVLMTVARSEISRLFFFLFQIFQRLKQRDEKKKKTERMPDLLCIENEAKHVNCRLKALPDSDINFNTPKKSTNSRSGKKREPNGILLKTHKTDRERNKQTWQKRKNFLEYFFCCSSTVVKEWQMSGGWTKVGWSFLNINEFKFYLFQKFWIL